MKHALFAILAILGLGALGSSTAAADPFKVARRHIADTGLDLYSYHQRFIGNTNGYSAPIIQTKDGGFLVVGTRHDFPPGKFEVGKSRPVVIKLDRTGQLVWEKAYKKQGFLDFEGASAVETAGGNFIVFIKDYVHPGRGSVGRFVKLDPSGKLLWERQLRGDGGMNTPHPQDIQLTPRGTVTATGHIYLDRKRDIALGWDGEVDADGKLIVDKVGGRDPYANRAEPTDS